MTQTPFFSEEELKRLNSYETEIITSPEEENNIKGPDTLHKTPTAEENKANGDVQPVRSPAEQGIAQLTGNKSSTSKAPENFIDKLGQGIQTAVESTVAPIMGMQDFGMDAIGRIPGAEQVDEAWDAKTKFKNPLIQKIREVSSVLLPSIAIGRATGGIAVGPNVLKGVGVIGLNVAGDVAVNAVSDQSEGETLSTFIKEVAPWMPVNEDWVVKPGDSPEVRRHKNMYESAGLSIIGDLLGFATAGAKPIMDWFDAKNYQAEEYFNKEVITNMDADTATKLSEIQAQKATTDAQVQELATVQPQSIEELAVQSINLDELQKASKALENESVSLTKEYISKGSSRVTEDPLNSFVERQQISRELQIDEVGKDRLLSNPTGVDADPFITPNLFPEGSSAALSVEPGYVARNAADVAAIKLGGSTGSPAPILSERAYYDISNGNTKTRDVVMGLAEAYREAGDFDAIVDGFRYTKAQMSDAAWKVYADIMRAGDVEATRKVFLADKDIKSLLDGRKVKYINDVQAEAVGYAMRDLVKQYIGTEVTEASARVMDTLGREVSDIAEGAKALPEVADPVRVQEMIGDRLAFLMGEYGINKYIAGWSLKNHDRWKMMFQKSGDKEATIKELMQQFDLKVAEKTQQAQGYKQMLQTITKEKPEAAQTLIDAFALTNGDVDTLDKLMKWAAKQMNPGGLIAPMGDSGGLNAFAQGAWAIRYGNVLSGISAGRAALGNAINLILRPINSYLGTGIGVVIGRQSIDDLKRAHYMHSATLTTANRALGDTWNHFKKLHAAGKWGDDLHLRPQMMARDDLLTGDRSTIEVLDSMQPIWEKQGNIGRMYQYKMLKLMHQIGNWNMLKYGTNMLESADMYVRTTTAVQLSRFRAYDEVMSIGYKGEELANQLAKAEKLAYDEMFDANGNITDNFLKHVSGEIAMQLDDPTADFINMAVGKLPVLKPFFMFPKTGVNGVKLAMSYTPLSRLMPKYGAILGAGDDLAKKKAALLQHGINWDTTPNAESIFKGLEAEYTGRVAFGSLLFTGLFGHALAGKIRGNGPPNESERKKLRDNFNWQPKMIEVGGKWVSFGGYEPLDTILSMVGDLAYYATDIGSPLVEDFGTKIAWTFAATLANKTWTQGLDPLLAIIDGDTSRLTRHLANEARSAIPWSGALGVGANAISSTQKDVYNDLVGYVKNRLPGLNTTLPEQIDIFTGTPLNDIDNPMLRAINAVLPVKVSDGPEPWRQWLINTGWDGIQQIRKDSTGNHEYTPAEREVLYKYIGEQQIWREFERLRKNKKYNDQLDTIRAMRVQGYTSDQINAAQVEAYKVFDDIVRDAQRKAEQRLQNENGPMWRSIQESIRNKNYMAQGRVNDARRAADRRKAEIEKLTQMYK